MEKEKNIRISEQYALTVDEAVLYFRIGENKIRNILSNNPHSSFILRVGNRTLIKRKKFEEFLNETEEV